MSITPINRSTYLAPALMDETPDTSKKRGQFDQTPSDRALKRAKSQSSSSSALSKKRSRAAEMPEATVSSASLKKAARPRRPDYFRTFGFSEDLQQEILSYLTFQDLNAFSRVAKYGCLSVKYQLLRIALESSQSPLLSAACSPHTLTGAGFLYEQAPILNVQEIAGLTRPNALENFGLLLLRLNRLDEAIQVANSMIPLLYNPFISQGYANIFSKVVETQAAAAPDSLAIVDLLSHLQKKLAENPSGEKALRSTLNSICRALSAEENPFRPWVAIHTVNEAREVFRIDESDCSRAYLEITSSLSQTKRTASYITEVFDTLEPHFSITSSEHGPLYIQRLSNFNDHKILALVNTEEPEAIELASNIALEHLRRNYSSLYAKKREAILKVIESYRNNSQINKAFSLFIQLARAASFGCGEIFNPKNYFTDNDTQLVCELIETRDESSLIETIKTVFGDDFLSEGVSRTFRFLAKFLKPKKIERIHRFAKRLSEENYERAIFGMLGSIQTDEGMKLAKDIPDDRVATRDKVYQKLATLHLEGRGPPYNASGLRALRQVTKITENLISNPLLKDPIYKNIATRISANKTTKIEHMDQAAGFIRKITDTKTRRETIQAVFSNFAKVSKYQNQYAAINAAQSLALADQCLAFGSMKTALPVSSKGIMAALIRRAGF